MSASPNPRVASRLFAALLSIPLRFKITVPYLVVAILLSGLATWLVSQSFARTLQDRFRGQLVDFYAVASDALFQIESDQLAAERAIARTDGVAPALASGDAESLDWLVRPLAVNARLELVHILDADGRLIYSLQGEEASADFASWPFVRHVLTGESDGLGDKYAGLAETPWGAALYTVGPVKDGSRVVGAVLVGAPLAQVIEKLTGSSLANVSIFTPGGQLAASTFRGEFPAPDLSSGAMAAVNVGGASKLQSRLFTLGSRDYNEALGPLVLRGEPSGWILGVALPRALATENEEISAAELIAWFALGVLAVIGLGVVVAQLIAIPVFELVRASSEVAEGHLNVQVKEVTSDELGLLGRRFNQMVSRLRQREYMRELFGRVVSEEVREALLAGQIGLGGEIKVVTVLFTDIRDFTSLSESYGPQEVVAFLNSYFAVVSGVIRDAGGLVNKFGGDSTLAVFGAPVSASPAETASKALRAALTIRARMAEFNAGRVQSGQLPLNVGIGINTGEVVTGNIGSQERFEYTVIGDTVNVAARVQALTHKFSETNILITDATLEAIEDRVGLITIDHGEIALKGKHKLVRVHGVAGTRVTFGDGADWLGRVRRQDAVEALYLYCRGFGVPVIAATLGVSASSVRRWLKRAADHFAAASGELRAEFSLTDSELARLARRAA